MSSMSPCKVGRHFNNREKKFFPTIVVDFGTRNVHTPEKIEHWERLFLGRRIFHDHTWFTVMNDRNILHGPGEQMRTLPPGRTLDSIADEFHPDLHIAVRATRAQGEIFNDELRATGGQWCLIFDGKPTHIITADASDGLITEFSASELLKTLTYHPT